MKLRKTEEEVVHGRLRGWDPYVCYPLNCSFALMTDFESSRCVITTRQEVRCIGDKSEKVEREPQWMVRSEMSYVDLSSSVPLFFYLIDRVLINIIRIQIKHFFLALIYN